MEMRIIVFLYLNVMLLDCMLSEPAFLGKKMIQIVINIIILILAYPFSSLILEKNY